MRGGRRFRGLQFLHDGRLVTGGRDHKIKLWDSQGNQQREFAPMTELVMKVGATHDGARVLAGDWTGDVRVYQTNDAKLLTHLAANPPTLEMTLQKIQAEEAQARSTASAAVREAEAAQKAFEAKRKAADEASAALARASKAAQELAAEKAAYDRSQAAPKK